MKKKLGVKEVLEAIAEGTMHRYEAADILDVSERQVNRLMRRYGVSRPASPMHDAREATVRRRLARTAAAQKAVDEKISPEQAADSVGVSVRTLFRYMAKLKKSTKIKRKSKKMR